MECHYSYPRFCDCGEKDHCGNLSRELLLVILLANGAPCPLFSEPLSPTFFLPHIGCQAVLTMNQSLGGLFDCRWAEEATGMHSFRSLSIGPGAFNNSLTYHFFSWDWENSLRADRFWACIDPPIVYQMTTLVQNSVKPQSCFCNANFNLLQNCPSSICFTFLNKNKQQDSCCLQLRISKSESIFLMLSR